MRRRRVDFPHPLGPISAVVRPGGKARSVGCSAAVPPKLLLTPTNSMSGCMQMRERLGQRQIGAQAGGTPATTPESLERCKMKNGEELPRISPDARELETGRGGEHAETVDRVLVGKLGNDFLSAEVNSLR